MREGHSMRIAKTTGCILLAVGLVLGFGGGVAMGAATLSKEIAPDVPPEILERLLPEAQVYLTGTGTKEVLLVADPFCENSRKTYRQLLTSRELIKTLRILWVSVYPQHGSAVVAAGAMEMQAAGKGEAALAVFELNVPSPAKIAAARAGALSRVNEKFGAILGTMDLPRLKPATDRVQRNTDLAEGIGYTGTPHLIASGRVLHGFSSPAIRILLRLGP